MNLYRGDKIFNKFTEPGLYRNNGLRSKSFSSGGNPANIELIGLLSSINYHINPNSKQAKEYYNVSDFLSFSESLDRSLYWCSDRNKIKLLKSKEYEETRYIFKFKIIEANLNVTGKGIYIYYFSCNPMLKVSDSGNPIHQAVIELSNREQVCKICKNKDLSHKIILINSYEYLIANANHSKHEKALEFAKQDQEWLLLPCDPLGKFRSSRIPRSDIWTVEHYIGENEIRPKVESI